MSAIKEARIRAGYKQRDVVALTGIPLGTLRRWEQGVNEPPIDAIIQLADLYECSTDELLGSGFAPVDIEYNVDAMTQDERELLERYRGMDEDRRSVLLAVTRYMRK